MIFGHAVIFDQGNNRGYMMGVKPVDFDVDQVLALLAVNGVPVGHLSQSTVEDFNAGAADYGADNQILALIADAIALPKFPGDVLPVFQSTNDPAYQQFLADYTDRYNAAMVRLMDIVNSFPPPLPAAQTDPATIDRVLRSVVTTPITRQFEWDRNRGDVQSVPIEETVPERAIVPVMIGDSTRSADPGPAPEEHAAAAQNNSNAQGGSMDSSVVAGDYVPSTPEPVLYRPNGDRVDINSVIPIPPNSLADGEWWVDYISTNALNDREVVMYYDWLHGTEHIKDYAKHPMFVRANGELVGYKDLPPVPITTQNPVSEAWAEDVSRNAKDEKVVVQFYDAQTGSKWADKYGADVVTDLPVIPEGDKNGAQQPAEVSALLIPALGVGWWLLKKYI